METQTKYFNSDIGNDEGEWANTYNNNRHSFSTSITSPSTSSSPWFKQQKQRHSKTSPCSVMEPPNTSLTRSFSSMSDSQLMHPNSSTSIDEEPFDCSRQLYKKSYSSLSVISSQNRNGIHCKKNNNNNNNNNNNGISGSSVWNDNGIDTDDNVWKEQLPQQAPRRIVLPKSPASRNQSSSNSNNNNNNIIKKKNQWMDLILILMGMH